MSSTRQAAYALGPLWLATLFISACAYEVEVDVGPAAEQTAGVHTELRLERLADQLYAAQPEDAILDPFERAKLTGTQPTNGMARDDASAPAAYALAAPTPNYQYFTYDECERETQQLGVGEVRRNRYAYCMVAPLVLTRYECDESGSACTPVGTANFRMMLRGQGIAANQYMTLIVDLDHWQLSGQISDSEKMRLRVRCDPNDTGCGPSPYVGSQQGTIAHWIANPHANASISTIEARGQQDGAHFAIDEVNYHTASVNLAYDRGNVEDESEVSLLPFRCDRFAYYGGGCIFDRVTSTLHYSLSAPDYAEAAMHINFAQLNPTLTDPSFPGARLIPGSPASGIPLTRLYEDSRYIDASIPGREVDAATYYQSSRAVVRSACNALTGGGATDEQCDEYPFASTYEGAYFTELYPGSPYKYSVRYINDKHNNRAGQLLQQHYVQDHLLAGDQFYVQIDP